MEAFMDEVVVVSEPGKGTEVHMKKTVGSRIGEFRNEKEEVWSIPLP